MNSGDPRSFFEGFFIGAFSGALFTLVIVEAFVWYGIDKFLKAVFWLNTSVSSFFQ